MVTMTGTDLKTENREAGYPTSRLAITQAAGAAMPQPRR
jgi:hypothetical protein